MRVYMCIYVLVTVMSIQIPSLIEFVASAIHMLVVDIKSGTKFCSPQSILGQINPPPFTSTCYRIKASSY
jgi:hypothetical protein